METKTVKVLAAVFVALTIVMAGLFFYEYSAANRNESNYNSLQSSYSSQQASVVLNSAYSHWDYIAIENTSLLAPQYMNNATLHWIGGPLSGTYTGIGNITSTWNRFFGLWSAVWFYAEAPPTVTINGNVANVSATIQFVVQNSANMSQFKYINVSYDLLYYNTGFVTGSGMPVFQIFKEVFQITGTNALNKV